MGHQGGQVRPELRGEARRGAGDFAMVHYIPGPVWREPRRWDGSERSEDVGGREGALPLQHQKLRPPARSAGTTSRWCAAAPRALAALVSFVWRTAACSSISCRHNT